MNSFLWWLNCVRRSKTVVACGSSVNVSSGNHILVCNGVNVNRARRSVRMKWSANRRRIQTARKCHSHRTGVQAPLSSLYSCSCCATSWLSAFRVSTWYTDVQTCSCTAAMAKFKPCTLSLCLNILMWTLDYFIHFQSALVSEDNEIWFLKVMLWIIVELLMKPY
jgi:hypothetical protein